MIFDIIRFGANIKYHGPAQYIISKNLTLGTQASDIIPQVADN